MADGTIDELSIEVSSDASSAASDIGALADAMDRLRTGIGGSASKLAGIADGMSKLRASVSGMDMSGLRELGNAKVDASVGKGVQAIADALAALPPDAASKLASLSSIGSLSALSDIKVPKNLGANLASAAAGISQMPADAAQRLSSLQAVRALTDLKVSSSVANQLRAIAEAAAIMPQDAAARFGGIAQSVAPLRELEGLSITKAMNALRELPDVLRAYEELDVSRIVQQLDLLVPRVNQLAAASQRLNTAFTGMPRSMRTAAAATRTVVSSNQALDRSMGSVGSAAKRNLLIYGSLSVAMQGIAHAAAYCTNQVNTYIENMNLFEASMGSFTQAATEFGQKVQDLVGIDFGDWARNQGVFQTLITGMGETADKAAVMSQQLTQLGYDIASFYNINVNDAMLKIQSGVAGELEPLRRLGWDLSDARMNLEMTKLGIEGTTQQMTQAEKVALRYYLIMTQVTQTHGDMARTIASPANQLRVLQAQLSLAARAIGSLLIPMINAILPYAIAAAKAIRMLAQTIASFFGIDASFEVDYSTLDTSGISTGGVDDLSDSLDNAGGAADKAAEKVKELKNSVMGFDELNKLAAPPEEGSNGSGGGAGGAGVGGVGGLDLPLETYDFLAGLDDYITKLSDGIAEKMVSALKTVGPFVAGIGAGIAAWKVAPSLISGLGKLAGKLANAELAAFRLASNLASAGRVRLGNLVGNVGIGLGNLAAGFGGMGAALAKNLGFIAVGVGVAVWRFTDLLANSEKFRDGLKVIGDVLANLPNPFEFMAGFLSDLGKTLSDVAQGWAEFLGGLGIDMSWVDGVLSALGELGDYIGGALMGVVDALDLNFGDLALTVGGVAACFVNPAFGAFLLALEGISLGVRAIGWASEPCVQQVDALGGVSEETAERFGTSLDSMNDAMDLLKLRDFSSDVVSEDDVTLIGERIADVRDTIVNNLDAKHNEDLAAIDALAGVCDEETIAAMRARTDEAFAQQVDDVTNGSSRITEIYRTAASEQRDLTQEECDEIARIQKSLQDTLIETSGASASEIESIRSKMEHNNKEAALSAAQEVVQKAIEERDARVRAAWDTYDAQMEAANMALEMGDITKEQYDAVAQAALQTAQTEQDAANDAFYGADGVVERVKSGLGDSADAFDFETGNIKSNWDVFCEDVAEAWDGFCTTATTAWESACGTWSGILDDFQSWCGSTWDGISSWATSAMDTMGQAWDIAVGTWAGIFSDAGASISSCWEDVCSGAAGWAEWLSDSIYSCIGPIGDWISSTLGGAWDTVCSIFSGNSNGFWTLRDGIFQSFKTVINSLVGGLNRAVSMPFDFINNNIISGLRGLDVMGVKPFGWLSYISVPQIPYFANGGFVDKGQLFVARESGPEMVGRMGGRTAVANNQQIVDGISAGVFKAIVSASATSSQGGEQQITIPLVIDGEELAQAVWRGSSKLARRGVIQPSFA